MCCSLPAPRHGMHFSKALQTKKSPSETDCSYLTVCPTGGLHSFLAHPCRYLSNLGYLRPVNRPSAEPRSLTCLLISPLPPVLRASAYPGGYANKMYAIRMPGTGPGLHRICLPHRPAADSCRRDWHMPSTGSARSFRCLFPPSFISRARISSADHTSSFSASFCFRKETHPSPRTLRYFLASITLRKYASGKPCPRAFRIALAFSSEIRFTEYHFFCFTL